MQQELTQGMKIRDRYTLVEYKGSGSFGEVWLAHDEVIDEQVALKIYISLDPRGIEEFKTEYKTTINISHSCLLTPNYFDVWEHRPFLVMKYCSNGSAASKIDNITEQELWQFIHDVAAGLEYLHEQPEPIIHQDIKPDNILIDDSGRYLLTDFGISKKLRSTIRKQSGRSTGAGAVSYMGPERFDADPTPIKASDIWSLGASIYELAMGELPFSGMGGVMLKNGAELPALVGEQWSDDLNQTMRACLAKAPWDRPTAKQLEEYASEKLEDINNHPTAPWVVASPVNASPKVDIGATQRVATPIVSTEPIPPTVQPKKKKTKALLTILFLLIGVVCAGGVYAVIQRKQAREWEERISKHGYLEIESISFANVDEDYDVINDYGSTIYASDVEIISAAINYEGLAKNKRTKYGIPFQVKVYAPNNTLFRDLSTSIDVVPGSHTEILPDISGTFKTGVYTFEVYYNNQKLHSQTLRLHKKAGEASSLYVNDLSSVSSTVAAAGETLTFNVTTDASAWNVTNVPKWCTVTQKTATSFQVRCENNTSTSSRTARLSVSSAEKDKTVQVSISQAGKVAPYLKVDNKTSLTKSYGPSAQTETFYISTNASSWVVEWLPSWCSVSSKTSTSFTLTCQANTSSSERSDYFRIRATDGSDKTVRIDIKQSGKSSSPYLKVDNKTALTKNYGASAQTETFYVSTSASSWVVEWLPSWCSVSGKTSTSFTLTCHANTSSSQRSDYFRVRTTDGTDQIVRIDIKQSGKTSSSSTGITGNIEQVWVDHNVYQGNVKGMKIHVKFTVNNMLNKTGRVSAYFHHSNGTALNDYNDSHRTSDGKVSTGTDYKPGYQNCRYEDLTIFMPYDELHCTGKGQYDLKFNCIVWDHKNKEVTRSTYTSFTITNN